MITILSVKEIMPCNVCIWVYEIEILNIERKSCVIPIIDGRKRREGEDQIGRAVLRELALRGNWIRDVV